MRNRFKGVFVAVLTPFTEKGVIDEKKLADHVEYLISSNIQGLFILGTTGLGPALTLQERKKVIDTVKEVVGKKLPVIAHITDIALPNVLDLAEYSSEREISAISVTAPYFYNGIDNDALFRFFKKIVDKASVPVLLYNQPNYTGINIPESLIAKLSLENEQVIGIKDSSGDLTQLFNYIVKLKQVKELIVLTGGDSIFYPALTVGADGIISALANIVPNLFTRLYDSFKKNNIRKALKYQQKINELRKILKSYSQLSGYYEASNLLGRNVGYPRLPIRMLNYNEVKTLKERLKKKNLLT